MRLAIRASPDSRLSIYRVFWGFRDNQTLNVWVTAMLTSEDVEIDEIRAYREYFGWRPLDLCRETSGYESDMIPLYCIVDRKPIPEERVRRRAKTCDKSARRFSAEPSFWTARSGIGRPQGYHPRQDPRAGKGTVWEGKRAGSD
jgi:hypothetical protein